MGRDAFVSRIGVGWPIVYTLSDGTRWTHRCYSLCSSFDLPINRYAPPSRGKIAHDWSQSLLHHAMQGLAERNLRCGARVRSYFTSEKMSVEQQGSMQGCASADPQRRPMKVFLPHAATGGATLSSSAIPPPACKLDQGNPREAARGGPARKRI